jgi:hypothetical protein
LRYRDRIIELYPEIFGTKEERESTEKTEGWGFETSLQSFNNKWGWSGWLIGLCNGDPLKLEPISELTLHQALIFTSYKIDWQKVQEKAIKRK